MKMQKVYSKEIAFQNYYIRKFYKSISSGKTKEMQNVFPMFFFKKYFRYY